jgi:hypothetical protein
LISRILFSLLSLRALGFFAVKGCFAAVVEDRNNNISKRGVECFESIRAQPFVFLSMARGCCVLAEPLVVVVAERRAVAPEALKILGLETGGEAFSEGLISINTLAIVLTRQRKGPRLDNIVPQEAYSSPRRRDKWTV